MDYYYLFDYQFIKSETLFENRKNNKINSQHVSNKI